MKNPREIMLGRPRALREKKGATEGWGWCLECRALRVLELAWGLLQGPHWEPGIL